MMYSKIIKRIIGDGARTNKFVVRFNDLGSYARDLNFTCISTRIPSLTAATVNYKYKGHEIEIPVGAKYGSDWSADFYMDEGHRIKKFFDDWIEMYDTRGENISMSGKAYKPATAPDGSTLQSFTCTVDIEQYPFDADLINDAGVPSAIYRIYNVFPKSTQEISLDDNDSLEKLSVTFGYSYYERIK